MNQEQTYNENELNDMIESLHDVMYNLELEYNSEPKNRTEIVWHLQQLTKIENLLINLQN